MSSGTPNRDKGKRAIGLGFRAARGGGIVVAVAIDGREPRVVLSAFLATAAEGDRLSFEPYHVAAEMARGADGAVAGDPAAVVAEGRKRQDQLGAKGLSDIVRKLQDEGCEPVVAALLINRATWITDVLAYSLAWPEHLPIAEGLAVRDALRFAIGRQRIDLAETDEKSLPEVASKELRLEPADIDARLKSLGATAGKPWRKEQKLACLAAWVAIAKRR
jgi:hypothetical protein